MMKRRLSLAIIPSLAALGACSASTSSTVQPGQTDGGGNDAAGVAIDGGTGDETAGDDGSTPAIEYDATLTGAEVVPAVTTPSNGTAKFFLQPDGVTLTYDITLSVPNATAVALHAGAPGEVGGVTHALSPVADHMTGSISLSMDETDAIAADRLYLDVQSQNSPAGEVRGQVVPPGSQIFVAVATGLQQIPNVNSAYHAHASFILSPDQGNVIYHFATDAVPSDVRLHRGIGAMNGPVAYPLSPVGQTIDGTLQISNSDATELENGRFYLNVLFAGPLSGANEVPPITSQATGGAQLVLVAAQDKVHYEAIVSGVIPTAASLGNAPEKTNGATMYQLTLNPQGALGETAVTPADVALLLKNSVFINVSTASYANGELRAQLTRLQ